MSCPMDAIRKLVKTLTPYFLDEDADLDLLINPVVAEFKLTGRQLSAHQRLVIKGAAEAAIKDFFAIPLVMLAQPVLQFSMNGPKGSSFIIEFGDGSSWEEPFANTEAVMRELIRRLQAVATHVPENGPANTYVLSEQHPRRNASQLIEVRARSPREAVFIHAACKSMTGGLRSALEQVADVMLLCPRPSWDVA